MTLKCQNLYTTKILGKMQKKTTTKIAQLEKKLIEAGGPGGSDS